MKLEKVNLSSADFFIRSYKLADAKSLYDLVECNHELLTDYFPMTVENNTSVMAKRQYILERNSERKSGKSLFVGIFLADNKTLIGQLSAKEINWRVPKCEMGYFLDKKYFGKGIGSAAVKLFSDYCFDKIGIAKIMLKIEPKNTASKKLAEKCGFNFVGLTKNDFRATNGRLMDCEIWEKINSNI